MKWMGYLLAIWIFITAVFPCACDDHAQKLPTFSISTITSKSECPKVPTFETPCSPFCQTCHHLAVAIPTPNVLAWAVASDLEKVALPTLCPRIYSRTYAIWQPPKIQVG